MLRRREFLAGCGSLSLAGLMPPGLAFGQATYVPDKIIDVHCHVFNADDLPIEKFIENAIIRTALEKKEAAPYAPVVDAILKDIARRLRRAAKDEDKYLDEIRTNPEGERKPADIANDERDFVVQLFADWANRPAPRLPRGTKLSARIINRYLPVIALGFIRRELFPLVYDGPVDFKLGSVLDNADQAFTLGETRNAKGEDLPELDSDYLARQAYDQPNGQITRNIKWVVSFTRYRRELLEDLNRVNHRRAVLVTPALVDFTKWLDAPPLRMPIPKQVAIMERLSREQRKNMPHVHGFVPFDPLRQAIHEKLSRPTANSPFGIVEKAIMQQGFIGVKLYPPMGFRASDNAAAGNDFPCWVRFGSGSFGYGEECENPKNGPDALGDEPGALFDAILMRLFEWCAAHNVPLLVHTNNSNSAGPGYGTRANPKYWQPVLTRLPALRVNFAHFGGFDEAYSDGRLQLDALDKTWEWTIGRMVAAAPERPIYADFSYFNELLDPASQRRKDTLASMRHYRQTFAGSKKMLLYGTDWSMIGHEDKFITSRQYLPDILAKFLVDAGFTQEDRENIFFRNAVRFLGLRRSDGENSTRGRLEKFCQTPEECKWLDMFDAVS